jgi:hypothetical protein
LVRVATGSKKYFKAQGEILEGVFARAVSNESFELLRKLLKNVPEPPLDECKLLNCSFICYPI